MSQAVAVARILIVDDNINALRALEYLLDREGLLVDCAASAALAIERLEKGAYDVVVSDLKMPGLSGMDLLEHVRKTHPDTPVIILTAHGTVENAVEAVRCGAYDYLQKPYQAQDIAHRVRMALEKQSLSREVKRLKARVAEQRGMEAMVGAAPPMARLQDQIRTVGAKDITVVIYGESGTGKELAARALHRASPRCDRPFVAVNCAAIPETLLENELFGHVKGAYTGASSNQRGLFEEAHTGTIFLDEIGDIPAAIQAKLLRVLQEQEFKKIGSTRDVRVDVRVIAATNKELREAVAAGKFREDLYYRINVIELRMPALRERTEDIPLLANYFRNLFNDELSLGIKGFSDDAIAQIIHQPWPGNVRELKNRVKMAMVMAKSAVITSEDLALDQGERKPALLPFKEAKEGFERDYVTRALRLCGGNVKKAAEIAGRDRSTFYDLLNKHQICADSFRDVFAPL